MHRVELVPVVICRTQKSELYENKHDFAKQKEKRNLRRRNVQTLLMKKTTSCATSDMGKMKL